MKIAKDKTVSGKVDTYVGEETSLEGNLTSRGNICIYGSIKGEIECQGRVLIGESGNIEADILANDVVVSGKVVGNVTAKGRLEMSPTGVIQGDIKTSRLIIEGGGKLDGHCEMLSDGKPAAARKLKAEGVPSSALPPQEQSKLPSASRN